MAVEGSQTPAGAGVPKLDLVVLGSGDQEALGRMPIARFCIPAVARQHQFAHAGGEVEDLQCRVVRGRDEFRIAWTPRQIPDGVVVGVVDGFDVVEVGPPVLNVSLLTAGYQPVMAVGPHSGRYASLVLIIMSLFFFSNRSAS